MYAASFIQFSNRTYDMKYKKGTTFDPVFMVGIVLLTLMVMVVFTTRNIGIPTQKSIEDVDRASAMERSKYMINALGNVEFGEVTEKLSKPALVKIEVRGNEKTLSIEDQSDSQRQKFSTALTADIAPGSISSDRIKFVKKQGKPITMQAG